MFTELRQFKTTLLACAFWVCIAAMFSFLTALTLSYFLEPGTLSKVVSGIFGYLSLIGLVSIYLVYCGLCVPLERLIEQLQSARSWPEPSELLWSSYAEELLSADQLRQTPPPRTFVH